MYSVAGHPPSRCCSRLRLPSWARATRGLPHLPPSRYEILRAALCTFLELFNPLIDPLANKEREKSISIVCAVCTSAACCFYGALLVKNARWAVGFRYLSCIGQVPRWLLEVASPRPPSLETFITAPRPPLFVFFLPHLESFFTPSRPKAQSVREPPLATLSPPS